MKAVAPYITFTLAWLFFCALIDLMGWHPGGPICIVSSGAVGALSGIFHKRFLTK